MIKPKY